MIRYSLPYIRETAFKKQNNIWNVLFAEHFALPLLWFVANFTRLTPNMITSFTFILFLGAAYLFFTGHMVWGAVVFEISHFFDIVDGRLAALKGLGSRRGQFYDTFADLFGTIAMTLGIAYSLFLTTADVLYLTIGYGYILLVMLLQVLYNVSYNLNQNQLLIKKMKVDQHSIIGKFRAYLADHRIRGLYTNVETNNLLFFVVPVISVFYAGAFWYGFILADFMLVCLFILFFLLQLRVLLKSAS